MDYILLAVFGFNVLLIAVNIGTKLEREEIVGWIIALIGWTMIFVDKLFDVLKVAF